MRLVLLSALLLTVRSGTASANPIVDPPEPSLREFVHTSWTQHDGFPLSPVVTISQTQDGYLWILVGGEGILRFDGVRFVPIPSPCGFADHTLSATGDRRGGLWLECAHKLYHRDQSGHTVSVQPNPLQGDLPTFGRFVDSQGRLWMWGRTLFYIQPTGQRGPNIPGMVRQALDIPCKFTEDLQGNIWVGSYRGAIKIRENQGEVVFPGSIFGVGQARSGGVYVLKERELFQIKDRSATLLIHIPPDILVAPNQTIVETKFGVWFGTTNRGLALFRHGRIQTFGRRDGLTSDLVSTVAKDKDGDVWVGTPLGLHRFRPPLAYLMSDKDGLPSGMPSFIFRDSKNDFWFGSNSETVHVVQRTGRRDRLEGYFYAAGETRNEVWLSDKSRVGYVSDGRFVPVPVPDTNGTPATPVHAFYHDAEDKLWALSYSGLYLIENRRLRLMQSGDFGIRFLVSPHSGTWIALRKGGLLHMKDGHTTEFGVNSGLPPGVILSIFEDSGGLWVATREGLSRWRNEKWTTWTPAQGLPKTVYEITTDLRNRLWLMTYSGILVLERSPLDSTPDGHPSALTYFQIGSLDRVMAHRGGLASSPRVTRGADGKLYFDTLDSVAVVDPANIVEPSFTPSLIVEDVLVNRRSVKTGGNQLFLKPDDIQFEYTSLNLRAPENVRFRYRLDGYDKDWVSAGTQRRASYGLLKPGSYRFRVVGSSGERGWSKQEASYAFRIGAPFYEQTPYRLAALCLLAAIFWLIHRYKLQREAAHVRLQAEAQGDERLRIAQDMHDTFLQGIQASRIMVEVGLNYMDKRPSESKRLLQRAVAIMSDATQQARQTVSSLRSTVPSSILVSRIEKLAAEAETHPVKALVKVESTGTPRKLCPTVDDDIYLTVSEAFRNALKHARAKQIQIAIHFRPAELEITVTDDGIGISPSTLLRGREGHFGLTGMRERAERVGGALRIDSDEGKGTQIRLVIPARRIYGERVFSASMRSPILSK